ncbi:MAG: ABC transporter permease [Eubacteriales bacterium]|nr:ABC transporter permease [Eubacteriales bacterium]
MKKQAAVRYVLKKLVRMMFLLALVSAATFALVSASPLDPLTANVGQAALGTMSREQIARLEEYWGTGIPYTERFLSWAGDFFRGDMGVSLLYRQPVAEVIRVKMMNSLWLMAAAWVISGAAGLFLGILAGIKKGKLADRLISGYALFMASTPAFWLALVLLMVFAVWLKWLPIGLSVPIGMETSDVTMADRIAHGILPALTLSMTGISNIALHTREKMITVMESDYVLFAKARGESARRIVWQHGIRNMILPAMTLQFASVSEIIGGSVLVEQVFSYPGLGQAAVTAGLGSDVPLLLGITVISAAVVFAGNLAADILYAAVDPRIGRERKRS